MRGILIICALAAPAFADDTAPPVTFHKGQVGVSARIALGERAVATYDNKYYCGAVDSSAKYGNAPVCTGRIPFSLGLEASYGVSRTAELVLEMRLGLERDFGPTANTDGPRPFFLAPGARFFFSEAARTKMFVQPNSSSTSPATRTPRACRAAWISACAASRACGSTCTARTACTCSSARRSRWPAGSTPASRSVRVFQGRYP